jgi:uncharacterized membrane protein YhaH (DUF805 family)
MDPKAIYENFRRTITEHYFDMNGRVGRGQFWSFVLASVVVGVIAAVVQSVTFLPVAAAVNLALLLPSAGMGARRLQDTGRNGQLIWALLIPAFITQVFAILAIGAGPFGVMGFMAFYFSIGWLLTLIELAALVALIYFWCQPGDVGPNAYGAPPETIPGLLVV